MWEGLTKKMRKKTKKTKILPRVPSLALGEESLSRVSEQDTRGRGFLPRVPCPGTRERASSPSAREGTRGRIFIFFCFFTSFFLWGLPTLFKTACSYLGQFWLILLYFVSFFRFVEFFCILRIWTAGAWNNGIWWFKKLY